MNLKDLKYFIAVAETGHFGRAAAQCFVSQPTLSMQLKKLEKELGVPLFERNNKRVLLTQTGEQLLQQAKRVLFETDRLTEMAKAVINPLGGTLRLGVIPTISPYLLPLVTRHITKAYPDLTLLIEERQTHVLMEMLQQGSLDCGILALPLEPAPILQLKLYQEHFVLAVSKHNPLAKDKTVTMKALDQQALLLLEEGHCLREQTLNFCNRIAIHERQDFRGTSLETLRQMVAANAGVTVLPQLAATQNYPDIKIIPFTAPQPYRDVVLICRDTFSRLNLLKGIQSIIQQEVKRYLK